MRWLGGADFKLVALRGGGGGGGVGWESLGVGPGGVVGKPKLLNLVAE